LNFRKELVKKFTKYLKQQQQQQQQIDFENLNKRMSFLQNHLKSIELLKPLMDNYASSHTTKRIDLFRLEIDLNIGYYSLISNESNEIRIEKLFIEMLFNGLAIHLIIKIIDIFNLNQIVSVKLLIRKSLIKICHLLKTTTTNQSENYSKLKVLIDSISVYLTENENKSSSSVSSLSQLINSEDVMEFMRSFCADQQVNLNLRLIVLEELKNRFPQMKQDDLALFLVYKTNAILNDCGEFDLAKAVTIDSNFINSPDERKHLILNLISQSQNDKQFFALFNLLKIWPHFYDDNTANLKHSNNILFKMITLKSKKIIENINEFNLNVKLNESDLLYIKVKLDNYLTDLASIEPNESDKDRWEMKVDYLKICLNNKNVKLVKNFVENDLKKMINKKNKLEMIEFINSDKELMDLIEKDQLYLMIINTILYDTFVNYILRNKTRDEILEMVRVLLNNNFKIEAATVLSSVENTSKSLRTLSLSLFLIDNFE
jgi:neuroblastoma-amplified sequence